VAACTSATGSISVGGSGVAKIVRHPASVALAAVAKLGSFLSRRGNGLIHPSSAVQLLLTRERVNGGAGTRAYPTDFSVQLGGTIGTAFFRRQPCRIHCIEQDIVARRLT